jgi:hypothetical protein
MSGDDEVELEVIDEDVTLVSRGPEDDSAIELIRMHLKEECTGVITFEKVFHRTHLTPSQVKDYERLLDLALINTNMKMHGFMPYKDNHSYGITEVSCQKLDELIQYLEFWGPTTGRRPAAYRVDHHIGPCFHIEGILKEYLDQVDRRDGMSHAYKMTDDYHLDNFLSILRALKLHWADLNFNKKCRLRRECKDLLNTLLDDPPTLYEPCCTSCCIL